MDMTGYGFGLSCFAMSAVLTCVLQWVFSIVIATSSVWIWFDFMGWEVIIPM